MRINKKLFILTILAFFMLAATVYASSSNFLIQAEKYINQNCSKKKPTDQTALLCYLFNKSQEQDASIASLSATLSPIPTQIASLQASTSTLNTSLTNLQSGGQKHLKTFDANGQELGMLVDSTIFQETVFNVKIGKLIYIDTSSSRVGYVPEVDYTTSDCSGTPYVQGDNVNNYLLLVGGKYMQVDTSPAKQTLTVKSIEDSPDGFCQTVPQNNFQKDNLRPIISASNPLQLPLAMPLQIKYQ